MNGLRLEHNVEAAMRDGVVLRANIYRPDDGDPHPVLLTRLPYGKDTVQWQGVLNPLRAALAGYVVIIQDCRGRFASGGDFVPFVHEGADGYDTVEWAAQLPYSTGAVGMFGASYYGFTQWAAAAQQPPHLKAIAPMITWSRHADGASFRHGAFELGLGLYWTLIMAVEVIRRKLTEAGLPPTEIMGAIRRLADAVDHLGDGGFMELPLSDIPSLQGLNLGQIVGDTFTLEPGSAGEARDVSHNQVEVPSLNIGGWYDIVNQGTIENFMAMRARSRSAQLLIGPWSHLNQTSAVSEAEFGMAANAISINLMTDLTALQLRWFDHWLKGTENGVDREPPVQVFMMGENRWRRMADWPPAEAADREFHLQPGGGLSQSLPPEQGGCSQYTYDPADPAPTIGGNVLMPGRYGAGVRDQRPLSARPDVLTFQGEPLAQAVTVAGRVRGTLCASSTAPDTDFVVRLLDIHPDGFMQNVCDGIVRARYRNSPAAPEWLTPGEVCELSIDLWSTAHRFLPGHRVGVQVTSSSFPRWDRNLNTGADPGSGTEGRPAEQTVWHEAGRASHISLPVLPE